jgi:hypothetical protein
MHTLMYLMDKLETAEAVVSSLKEMNIGYDGYRLVSKDADGIRRHHLHSATPLDQTDILHSGERGALIGGGLGMVFALGLVLSQPFGVPVGWAGFLFATAIIGSFGAWTGGLVGLSHENYKLKPFHRAIEQGKYLMMIGLRDREKVVQVKQAMHKLHPDVSFVADDEAFMDPFTSTPEFRARHIP